MNEIDSILAKMWRDVYAKATQAARQEIIRQFGSQLRGGALNGSVIAGAGSMTPAVIAPSGTPGDVLTSVAGVTAWTAPSGGGGGGTALFSDYILCNEQQASGTHAGGFTSGSWVTRVLNTKVADTGSIATLAGNQISIPAGTYRVLAFCPVIGVDNHQAQLYNVTDSVVLVNGVSSYAAATPLVSNFAFVDGWFTIAGTKTVALKHRCSTTCATYGLGGASTYGTETYATLELWKV